MHAHRQRPRKGQRRYLSNSRDCIGPCDHGCTRKWRAERTKKEKGPGGFTHQGPSSRRSPTFPQSSIIGRRVLTSEFGMGSGISPCVSSPTNPSGRFHARTALLSSGWLPDESGSASTAALARGRDASDACGRRRCLHNNRHHPFWGVMLPGTGHRRFPWRVTEPGRHGQAIDRSYRFAERISPLTRAADQPRGLRGVFRLATWNVYLEVGFSLRCFQRLSLPHLATQLWTERSNWHTRGASFPILSY